MAKQGVEALLDGREAARIGRGLVLEPYFATVILGFRHIFVRVPWQRSYIAIFAAFLGTVGESFIIDTDHWRHFFMMLGAMWGMFAAARTFRAEPSRSLTAVGIEADQAHSM